MSAHSFLCNCGPCLAAWNAGAAQADAHWADDPQPPYELTPQGEILGNNDRQHQHQRHQAAIGEKDE